MKNVDLPVKGDVIVSKRFINGVRDFDPNNPVIHVGSETPKHIVSRHMTDDEIVAFVQNYGKMPTNRWVEEDFAFIDVSRGFAEFVLIAALLDGGGTGMGTHDVYPDGWHVTAKRLNIHGDLDESGEEIQFYMTGCFVDMIPPEEITVVRKMKVSFS